MNLSALIYGNQKHYLDHLAPLASFLKIPLIVTEVEIETLAKTFYPKLNVIYFGAIEVAEKIVSNFEVVISCLPKDLLDSIFFITESLHQKELIKVWCPHGNSDKGHASYFMEGLSKERFAFVYGQKMVNFLKEKGAFNQVEEVFFLGNYRYKYFKKHADFFHAAVKKNIPLDFIRKTLLYAPTWKDEENSSSFDQVQFLIDLVPDDWNLIIKPHPHLQTNLEIQKENIFVLKDFPPIYPLLECVDFYLGDMSSIGYDFLTFRRPQFFLNPQNRDPKTDKGLYLTKCGTIVDLKEDLFSLIESTNHAPFIKIQEEVYDEVFEKRETIKSIYEAFPQTV